MQIVVHQPHEFYISRYPMGREATVSWGGPELICAVGPDGKIDVRLSQAGPREALLEINDDGPGVPAADRASIFKPYVTMKQNGVGLGLAIVQQIVSAHHWTIACEANEPRGASFRIGGMKLVVAST